MEYKITMKSGRTHIVNELGVEAISKSVGGLCFYWIGDKKDLSMAILIEEIESIVKEL